MLMQIFTTENTESTEAKKRHVKKDSQPALGLSLRVLCVLCG
jgi:hypothetical protein